MPRPHRVPATRRPRLRLGSRIAVLTALLLSLVVLLGTAAAVVVLRRDLTEQYEQRALAIARSVAQLPGLPAAVTGSSPAPEGPVEQEAEAVRRATGALYVVVTDDRGIRFSHPTRARIGERVSTSPEEALSGHDVVTVERGTLGRSARGKVPLRDDSGAVVGEVSVGIEIAAIDQKTRALAVTLGLIALVPLALGIIGAISMGRRLRRTTLGLEPEQMADLVREHEAVLHGVTDGILAVDNSGRVTVTNPQAVRLLGSVPRRGEALDPAAVDPAVVELMTRRPAPRGALRIVADRAVLATRLPVQRDGRDLGEVLILRDRSDLDTLARELEATRALTDALRAQAHEHTNRLHALAGLLHRGHVSEALAYLEELSGTTTWVAGVDDPYLAGVLAAKAAAASESGVTFEVTPESFVAGRLVRPLDTVTVVANLLDNAVRAAATGVREPARVEVTLLSDEEDLVVHVRDTGDGVPADAAESVFDHGWTSRPDEAAGHGLGLSLARHTARSGGGDIVLIDPGGPPPASHGAVFEARLRGVIGATAKEMTP
ncbi:two-component system, CitB family, sensor kinase [Marmoricola sp. URHA0025 HA25]